MNQIEKLLQTNPEALTKRLGRLPAKDPKDENYMIPKMLRKTAGLTSRYWNDNPVFLDQGNEPQCVDFGWHHSILDGPIKHGKKTRIWEPGTVYREAQKVDEWPGEDYDGTSVRAGAKVLQAMGIISEYRWAWDVGTLINSVLTLGPAVVGTNWYRYMFLPDANGLIKVGGQLDGGHCYVVNGVNTKTKLFRIKNSWNQKWGIKGRAYISFEDMERLISEDGEICLAVESK